MVQVVPGQHVAVINVYSHNIQVTGGFKSEFKQLLDEFCYRNAAMKLQRVGQGRYEKTVKHVYGSATRGRSEYRFHRNQLDDLLSFLSARGVYRDSILINHVPLYEPTRCEIKFTDPRQPRDLQIPLINYLLEPCPENYAPSKVITLQTGKGKGYISIKALSALGMRTVVLVKPMYIEKWALELKEMLELGPEELMVVRGLDPKEKIGTLDGWDGVEIKNRPSGSEQMMALMNLQQTGQLKAKIIIISNVVFSDYIDNHIGKNLEQVEYPFTPGEFYERMGVGVRLIDEVHMEFHRNYRFDVWSHVPLTISLSATLDSDDSDLNRRYLVVWPALTRPPETEYHAFIDVVSLLYSIEQPHLIKCTGFAKSYSHVKFEESILKSSRMTRNYLAMLADILDVLYASDRQPGQSALMFCATVEMCTRVADHLQKTYPELNVKRYVSGDDFEENFLKPDVVVSTVGSAGTAVDKPNLRETIMTNALNSKQSNIQVLGRTRELRNWPDISPRFTFLAAREIRKHMEYAKAKPDKFRGKVRSFRTMQSHYRV